MSTQSDNVAVGHKDDNGKLRFGLILKSMAICVVELVKLAEFGAKRYGEDNWQEAENGADRYMEGLLRHLNEEYLHGPGAIDDGEQGSQLLHATAIAWNAMAYLWFVLKGKY